MRYVGLGLLLFLAGCAEPQRPSGVTGMHWQVGPNGWDHSSALVDDGTLRVRGFVDQWAGYCESRLVGEVAVNPQYVSCDAAREALVKRILGDSDKDVK